MTRIRYFTYHEMGGGGGGDRFTMVMKSRPYKWCDSLKSELRKWDGGLWLKTRLESRRSCQYRTKSRASPNSKESVLKKSPVFWTALGI